MAEVLSGPLQTQRQRNGRRKVLRPFVVRSRGHVIVVPDEFETDFSSYPVAVLIFALAILLQFLGADPLWMLLLLLIPSFSRTDAGGTVHDWLFLTQQLSWWESNLVWWDISRSGFHRAGWAQGVAGFSGLTAGSGIPWLKYKRRRNDPQTLALINKASQYALGYGQDA